ncbi:MAG: T9SS type A sorting domain-containing protein [Chitinophagales bacterium]|nr:T9SS type A sorting domain-containing protein [Chitinophagales bacterium]
MKNVFAIFTSIFLIGNIMAQAICSITPPLSEPGFEPNSNLVSCMVKNQPSSQSFKFRVPASIGNITINWMAIDSITNLPAGLTYQLNKGIGVQYNANETGCVKLSGTPTSTVGQYRLGIYVRIKVNNVLTLPGELYEIFTSQGADNPEKYIIWLRLKDSTNAPCPCIDTTQTASGNLKPYIGNETSCLTLNTLTTNESCHIKNDGSITITASGGTPPYSYQLNNQVYQSSNVFNGLAAGTYSVKVKDANNDSVSINSVIMRDTRFCNPSPACGNSGSWTCTATPLVQNGFEHPDSIDCFVSGESGEVVMRFKNFSNLIIPSTGSVNVYFIRIDSILNLPCGICWSTNKANNVFAGGEDGCIKFTGTTTDQVGQYKLKLAIKAQITQGIYNPQALIDPPGGLMAYENTIPNLRAYIRVKASSNSTCTSVDTTGIIFPNLTTSSLCSAIPTALSAISVNDSVSCNGRSDGSITITALGGTPPYSYQLNNQTYQSSNIFSGLAAGNYTYTVKDAANISIIKSVNIAEPMPLLVFLQINSGCSANSDSIFSAVQGGTPPYTYNWNTGAVAPHLYNLSPGKYIVTITDSKGCTNRDSIQLTATTFTAQSIIGNPSITPFQTFTYLVSNIMGHTYSWSVQNGAIQSGQSTNSISVVWGGNGPYRVTLIEENASGCKDTTALMVIDSNCTLQLSIMQSGTNYCDGGLAVLSVQALANTTFQWFKNGISLVNETNDSLFVITSGSYQVQATQGSCMVFSGVSYVVFQPAPAAPSIVASNSNLSCTSQPITLSTSNNYNSYLWSNGASTSSIAVTQSGLYSVTVSASNGCQSSSSYNVNFSMVNPVDICMVTTDSSTGFNLIVWEKPQTNMIDSFVILKETNQANIYQAIGKQAYSNFSTFLDVNSNSSVQAYRYKLALVDSCGILSAASQFHKTIHLSSNLGVGGSVNLAWSHYEGISTASYNIYRGTSPQTIQLLATVASSLNSYTDLTPPSGNLFYFIEIVFGGCNPTALQFMKVRSNIIGVQDESGIDEISEIKSVSIAPNPNTGTFNLTVESLMEKQGKITVADIAGRVLVEKFIHLYEGENKSEFQILNAGYYLLALQIENETKVIPIIVSR